MKRSIRNAASFRTAAIAACIASPGQGLCGTGESSGAGQSGFICDETCPASKAQNEQAPEGKRGGSQSGPPDGSDHTSPGAAAPAKDLTRVVASPPPGAYDRLPRWREPSDIRKILKIASDNITLWLEIMDGSRIKLQLDKIISRAAEWFKIGGQIRMEVDGWLQEKAPPVGPDGPDLFTLAAARDMAGALRECLHEEVDYRLNCLIPTVIEEGGRMSPGKYNIRAYPAKSPNDRWGRQGVHTLEKLLSGILYGKLVELITRS